MLTLETTQTLRAVAGTATAVTYTIFGDEVGASDAFKVLAQGQIPSSVGTLYTVPGSTSAIIKSVRLANATGSPVTGIKFYVGGTAAANQITGTFDIPANGTASLAGDRVEIHDATGALIYAGIVPTTRQVIAGSALTGGGALSADVTLDVGVDGSTIEVNSDALRVKDAGITGAKIASSVALAGSPTTTTQTAADNSTKIATTAYADTGLALKANLASPTFTGTPAAPTPSAADSSTKVATTAFVQGEIAAKAPLASPTFTGNPLAPTPSANDNDTSIATTAYVQTELTDYASDTVTLTNKRITKRVSTTASTATLTVASDDYDAAKITAQAAALAIAAPTGTPTAMQGLIIRVKDNGTARAITWTTGSSGAFRAIGVTLPTTTVISKTLYVGCVWNSDDSRWDVLSVAQEA